MTARTKMHIILLCLGLFWLAAWGTRELLAVAFHPILRAVGA